MERDPYDPFSDVLFLVGLVASLLLAVLPGDRCDCLLCRSARKRPAPAPECACGRVAE